MSGIAWIPLAFVVAVVAATIGLGVYATRISKTASDFFVAGRTVSVFWNASAISGEYLSAASFMGIAGMVMKYGYDTLWYPVGYAFGYLFLLLFIAGPLRRFGAYTIPDFAEGRFGSPAFRRIAVSFVLFIGFFYTMPQMKGAGITLRSILDAPYWFGVVAVGAVITFNVAIGGMKGITFVQAFQYWLKLFAISAPVFVLMSVYGGYGHWLHTLGAAPAESPKLKRPQEIALAGHAQRPLNQISFSPAEPTLVTFTEDTVIRAVAPARKPLPGEDRIHPSRFLAPMGEEVETPEGTFIRYSAGATVSVLSAVVMAQGRPVMAEGKPARTGARLEMEHPTRLSIPAGQPAPNAPSNARWERPFGALTGRYGYPLLYTYSLVIAIICGTAGLPHILVRFYTNPDGSAAKRTTFWVMVLIGTFYLFTAVWGVLGRALMPELYATGQTDRVVIELPRLLGGLWGQVLSGITSAGAFAAFMSTFSGLLVSMSGALAHDIYGKILRPQSTPQQRLAAFKVSALLVGGIATILGLGVESFDINMMVGWAFAVGAASYFPLLLLGTWWRGLTVKGAATGMLGGGLLSLAAIVTHMLLEKGVLRADLSPILRTLLEQPAIWGVPLSLLLMVAVSRATRREPVPQVSHKMLHLHAPEHLGLARDYIRE